MIHILSPPTKLGKSNVTACLQVFSSCEAHARELSLEYASSFELSIQVIKLVRLSHKLQKQTPQLLSRINICFMFSYLLWHRCCLYSFSFDIVRFFSINRMKQWCEVCLEAWRAVISSAHKCASCSLFTPSTTCHEQALCWRILVMLVGISLSNREVTVTCQWW